MVNTTVSGTYQSRLAIASQLRILLQMVVKANNGRSIVS